MTRTEVYENLCSYDPRNPLYEDLFPSDIYYEDEIDKPRGGGIGRCYCDNCFEGKDKLALEILRLMDILEESLFTLAQKLK